MVSCPRCGAHIDPAALACPYCQTQTPYGQKFAEQLAAHQQHAAQVEQAQRAEASEQRARALRKKAQHGLFWSLGGLFTCCFPAAIIGLLLGLNVKSAAKREGVLAPVTATVSVVLGCLSLALFGAGVALYVHESRATEARIAELQAKVDAAPPGEQLEQPLACALTELVLLKEGFAGTSGLNIDDFECAGRVEREGDGARLGDVRFKTSSTERRTVAACLTRGARWSVKELREDGRCEPRQTVPGAVGSAP